MMQISKYFKNLSHLLLQGLYLMQQKLAITMQHLYSSCHVFVRNNRYEWPPSLFLFLSNISLIKLLTDTHKFTNRSSYIKNESTKHLQFINKWVICLCWHLRIYHQSKVCKLHFLKNCKIVNFQQDCQFIQDVKLWMNFKCVGKKGNNSV